jgi:LysR family nitrogen assimilation transcriptional regulator
LEIRQLRYFMAIYEAGSVTKASARLLVAQSALSQQLAHLEDELGVPLFTRSPQGVTPTAFGQELYHHSQEILQRVGSAVESVRQLGRNPTGTVTVGMPESISAVLGLALLQSVKQCFPGIQLLLTEDMSANLKARLREVKLDLAILVDDGMNDGLSVVPLVVERLALVSQAAGQPDTVTLADALAHPLALLDARDRIRGSIESAARAAGLQVASLLSEVSSLTVIKSAAVQGLAATILPLSAVALEVSQGILHAQEITHPAVQCTVALYTRNDALIDLAAASVLRLVASTARELCTSGLWRGGTFVRVNGVGAS